MKRTRPKTGALLACALAAILAVPAAADATWTVKGRGFGHGVGLSQYGAYGYAKHGRDYKRILKHYYTKTKVRKAKGGRVRVLLGSQDEVGFTGASQACGRNLQANGEYSFTSGAGEVTLLDANGDELRSCGGEGVAKGGGGVEIDGHGVYRGDLVARADGGSLLVINSVGLEGYIKGVVANEMPSSWHKQALKAQAVVARSYGLATERSGAFDHYDDTRSQVYGGRATETKSTNRAVKRTRRRVVKHDGEVVATYYFSTSGGQTENSEFGFSGGSRTPYLKSVKDRYDDISPIHKWTATYSDSAMESRLEGLFGGDLEEIRILKTGRSPRIVQARVVGSSDSSEVSGDTLRSRLGLRSTWAKFSKD